MAHHQRGTLPIVDTEAEAAARRARFAEQDAAYRALLRLEAGDKLPGSIGQVSGGGGAFRRGFDECASGGRLRRKASHLVG